MLSHLTFLIFVTFPLIKLAPISKDRVSPTFIFNFFAVFSSTEIELVFCHIPWIIELSFGGF